MTTRWREGGERFVALSPETVVREDHITLVTKVTREVATEDGNDTYDEPHLQFMLFSGMSVVVPVNKIPPETLQLFSFPPSETL